MTLKTDLESEVKEIFESKWTERDGQVVPEPEDLKLGNDAVNLNATVLYADIADSTNLVDQNKSFFAAEIYKVYLLCAVRIIKDKQGTITAYDGDRVMAVYLGDSKNTSAVRSALMINYAVREIINPLLKKQYPKQTYQLKQVIGVDTSNLFVARIGVRVDNDLVWVGRAANYAAKLCSRNGDYSIYITDDVHNHMQDSVKYDDKKKTIWQKEVWEERNNKTIYGTSGWISFT